MQKVDFPTYRKKASDEIEKELRNFSQDWNKIISHHYPSLKLVNKRFTESLFGGKMLRGTLVKLGYDLVQEKPNEAIFKPAAAFEILHTALLIHDDIIDQSPIRRGKPAVHVTKHDPHYGISQAICLGDLGITTATKLITESDFSEFNRLRALTFFLQIIQDTIVGQMLDIESSQKITQNEEQIIEIARMKTAKYSFIGPLSLGAILGGASDELLRNIKMFGENLGIAYQMQDDLLGVFGDEKTVGKSITSDIEENKNTLLIMYSRAHASVRQKEILKLYGKKGITKKELETIRNIFKETRALEYSQEKVKNYVAEAKEVIPFLSTNKTATTLLTHFVNTLVERKK